MEDQSLGVNSSVFKVKFTEGWYEGRDRILNPPDEINLVITNIEFGEKVKLHWINPKTNELGYTEVTHETYNEKFR